MTTGSPDSREETAPEPAADTKVSCSVPSETEGGPESGTALEHSRCVNKVRQFNRFIDEVLAGLPPLASLLWLTLFRHAYKGVAKVSQENLARTMGVATSTVKRNLEILRKAELVRLRGRGVKGKSFNAYQLGIRPPPARKKASRVKKPGSPRKPS